MLLKEITYCDYPAGKTITPFQTVDGDNYFMEAGGTFTYLGSYEEIGNIRNPRTGVEKHTARIRSHHSLSKRY